MKTVLLDPSSCINNYILNLLKSSKDYSDTAVIFPGVRPSHFLLKTILKKEQGAFIPPDIFSINEFVNSIYTQSVRNDIKINENDAISVLFELHLQSSDKMGNNAYLSFDSFYSVGSRIYNDFEELIINQVPPEKVREIDYIAGEEPVLTSVNLKKISLLYENYLKFLSDKKLSTRAMRYAEVSKTVGDIDLAKYKKIIFAGLFPGSKSEISFLKKLHNMENTCFIFQDSKGIDEVIKKLEIEAQKEGSPAKATVHFYASPDTHGQVFSLSGVVKKLLENENLNTTENVIVLPKPETLFPLLNHSGFLKDEGEYNISMGYPLFRTPVFGFFNNVLSLISNIDGKRVYIKDYLKFILHPYTKNIKYKNNASVTRILLHTFEEEFSKTKLRSFYTLEEIEEMNEVYKSVCLKHTGTDEVLTEKSLKEHLRYIHDNTVRKLMEFNDIKDFLSKSSDVIRFIGERTTASYHPYFNSFYERFLKELDSIKKSFISKYRFTDIKRYFFLFQSVFKRVSLPFDGTPLNGLQILGFLETRNIKFKNVYFFDVNEGVIPHTTKEESVLPTGVREHLGISTYKTKEKVARYYFDILIKSSENVHLFYIENNKSQRSRFAEELCWEEEKKTGKSEAAEKVKNIEYKINLNREASAGAEKTKEIADYFKEEFRYSASALNSYLHCGLKFYYSYALKLSEDGELAGEVEKKDIGNIVHEVLESYFEKLSGKVLEPGDINTALLDDIINLKFKEMFSDNLPGRIFLIKNQISYQLKKFMENYQLPLVLKSKVKVLGNEMKINADINGYRFKGFLDRVEERDDITYIIDYKTSSSDLAHKINFKKLDYESRESIETCIKSLQIPFYLMLYSNHKKTDVKDLRGIFLLLGKSKIDEKIEFNPFENEEEILKHYPKLLKLMFTLLDEICNKDIPFAAAKDEKTCMFCDFKSLCKTG